MRQPRVGHAARRCPRMPPSALIVVHKSPVSNGLGVVPALHGQRGNQSPAQPGSLLTRRTRAARIQAVPTGGKGVLKRGARVLKTNRYSDEEKGRTDEHATPWRQVIHLAA